MIVTYFIVNKLGTVIYQSRQSNSLTNTTESHRIRYLPLLVIKDLIKANLNDILDHIRIGNKTVVFREQQNLMYIACTNKKRVPVSLLQLHLRVMHHFIKFHYGPHWSLQLEGNSSSRRISISLSDISACLAQLPFIYQKLSTRSSDCLCLSEQVQVSEDLRSRLTENMIQCCNTAFVHHYHKNHFFSSPTMHSIDQHESSTATWSCCFLFAREKLVAQSSKDLPDEFVYFCKLMVTQYLQEKHESGIHQTRTTTLPQDISPSRSTTTLNHTSSPSSSKSEASSIQSSLAYVYDANSNTAPFKIREKSASSVTVVSSDSSISYWSTPLVHTIKTPQRVPSNVLKPHHQLHPSMISDILNMDEPYTSFLSSSVPSQVTPISPKSPTLISSAPSSPTHSRSRSISLSQEDFSLKHLLTNLIKGETSYLDQTEDVKLVRRWVKLDGHVYLANFILVLIHQELCAIVVCKDDPERISYSNTKLHSKNVWKPMSTQVKRFKSSLRSCLKDFSSFLLTKEATHFTNLSFATTYPGLVHFCHFDKGIMTSPSVVDLNELDKNHELLHEVYSRYNTDRCPWVWPNEPTLKKLHGSSR
ncbi:uncharacterized protein B0P05DRAFT_583654 [Gilbertella persicaria]|uniref:uncharacterized protein n=1 Tax=Gilbertella persicaria TaxID=101096 RepID=UPI0022201C6F|nr:uncharacterized protein B0P05DRAFT_583654 [Gilbertella persicaria]KAI8092410.1 hypothetical protein B0P05DRAFT_583654 [Gilbertella persicaria]